MKTILRPSLAKAILTLVLFVLASFVWRLLVTSRIMDLSLWGVPLAFYTTWGPCPPGETCQELSTVNLVLDILFWYLGAGLALGLIRRKTS